MAHGSNAQEPIHHKSDRDKISSLTRQLVNLGKPVDGPDHGMGIVTLAGSNKGAVMKASLLDEAMDNHNNINIDGSKKGGEEKLSAFMNSNYQAVNNSIMIDGKLETEDPGVHIEIVDCMEGSDEFDEDEKKKEKKKKKKKKERNEKHSKGKDEKIGSESEGA